MLERSLISTTRHPQLFPLTELPLPSALAHRKYHCKFSSSLNPCLIIQYPSVHLKYWNISLCLVTVQTVQTVQCTLLRPLLCLSWWRLRHDSSSNVTTSVILFELIKLMKYQMSPTALLSQSRGSYRVWPLRCSERRMIVFRQSFTNYWS